MIFDENGLRRNENWVRLGVFVKKHVWEMVAIRNTLEKMRIEWDRRDTY